MSFEEGSLCEPLAVALAGLEKANVRLGDPVVVWYVPSSFLLRDLFTFKPYYPHSEVISRDHTQLHYRSNPFGTLADNQWSRANWSSNSPSCPRSRMYPNSPYRLGSIPTRIRKNSITKRQNSPNYKRPVA